MCSLCCTPRFSALQRAEIAEIMLIRSASTPRWSVSVLFNEPKLLKSRRSRPRRGVRKSFSALQRAEIAEMLVDGSQDAPALGFSALQRAEIAEIVDVFIYSPSVGTFQCSSTSRNC